MNDRVEKYRAPHPAGLEHGSGDDYGWFKIPGPCGCPLFCMTSPSDDEWLHISVSTDRRRCPNWPEMSFIKDLFFDPEDVVVQFHPKHSEYVNQAPSCLHLWKWNKGEFPRPPMYLVGIT